MLIIKQLMPSLSSPAVAPSSPVLQVWVEALHITHQPVCWARLSGLVSGGPKDTQAARLTQATTLLDSPEAQMVAQSHRFISTSVLPAITVQVCSSSAGPWQACAYGAVCRVACYTGLVTYQLNNLPTADKLQCAELEHTIR